MIKTFRWVKGPTARLPQTLRFCQEVFICLQFFVGDFPKAVLRMFSALNMRKARAVPLNDRSVRDALRDILIKHPAKLTVSPTYREASVSIGFPWRLALPFLEEHSDIVQMNAGGPFPPVEFFLEFSDKFAPVRLERNRGWPSGLPV